MDFTSFFTEFLTALLSLFSVFTTGGFFASLFGG